MKFQSLATKLGPAIACCLFASSAAADSIYSTYHYLFDSNGQPKATSSAGTDYFVPGDWAAGYFFVNPVACSNGCDLTSASVRLLATQYDSYTPASLAGIKLEIFSNAPNSSNAIGKGPGTSLFTLTSPTSVLFNGNFGTTIEFSALPQSQSAPALLQPNTAYWLKLTSVSQSPDFEWFYNGVQSNEYWASHHVVGNQVTDDANEGSPFIFQINGVNSATSRLLPANVPLPGAVWLMSSALIGLGAVGRKKR